MRGEADEGPDAKDVERLPQVLPRAVTRSDHRAFAAGLVLPVRIACQTEGAS